MLNWDELLFNPLALTQPTPATVPGSWVPTIEPPRAPQLAPAAPKPTPQPEPPAWAALNSGSPVLGQGFPLSPGGGDYDPFKAFAPTKAPEPKKLGVLGESFGVMAPADQQQWLTDQFADYTKGSERIKSLEAAIATQASPYAKRALQAQLVAARGALPDIERLNAMKAGTAALPTKTGLRAGVENAPRGFADAVLGIPEMIGIVKGYLGDEKVDDNALLKWSLDAKKYVAEQFPGDAARQADFSQQLANGVGQLGAFYGGGAVASLARLGAKGVAATVALMGSSATGSQGFEEATAKLKEAQAEAVRTGDKAAVEEIDRILQTVGYAAVGLTEAIPVAKTFSRLAPNPATGLGRRAVAAAEGSLEEGLQEGVSQAAQNAIAAQTTDPARPLGQGVAESIAVGAVLGGGAGGAFGAAPAGPPPVKEVDPFVEPPEMRPGEPLSFIDLIPGEGYTEVTPARALSAPRAALPAPEAGGAATVRPGGPQPLPGLPGASVAPEAGLALNEAAARAPQDRSPPGFYSAALRAAEALPEKGSPEQLLGILRNTPGVKPGELEWMELEDFVREQKPTTRQEIADYMAAHQAEFVDDMRGYSPEYAVLAQRKDDLEKELIGSRGRDLSAKEIGRLANELHETFVKLASHPEHTAVEGKPRFGDKGRPKGGSNYRELLLKSPMLEGKYTSDHFLTNELMYLRLDDRVGPQGEKTLNIVELQSDLHQRGARSGYKGTPAQRAKAQQEFDAGMEQLKNARANNLPPEKVSELIQRVGTLNDQMYRMDSPSSKPNAPFKGSSWEELGIKRALRMAAEQGYDAISWMRGDQTTGSGRAKVRTLYDVKMPGFLNRYTKKWGGKVEKVQLADSEGENNFLRITPEMRAALLGDEQPLFAATPTQRPQMTQPALPAQQQSSAQPRAARLTQPALPEQPYRAVNEPGRAGTDRRIELNPALTGKQAHQQAKLLSDAGRTVQISQELSERILGEAEALSTMIPEGTLVGALTRIEPAGFDEKGKPQIRAVFALRGGGEQGVRTTLKQLSALRATTATTPDGRRAILFPRLDPAESSRDRIRGELWHENLHILRGQGNIPADAFNRLLGHATDLRVLDIEYRAFARATRDPRAEDYVPGVTIRKLYAQELYKDRPDLEEAMAQEAVAHLLELYSHGALTEQQIAPIQDVIGAIRSGEYARRPAAPRSAAGLHAAKPGEASMSPMMKDQIVSDVITAIAEPEPKKPSGDIFSAIDAAPKAFGANEVATDVLKDLGKIWKKDYPWAGWAGLSNTKEFKVAFRTALKAKAAKLNPKTEQGLLAGLFDIVQKIDAKRGPAISELWKASVLAEPAHTVDPAKKDQIVGNTISSIEEKAANTGGGVYDFWSAAIGDVPWTGDNIAYAQGMIEGLQKAKAKVAHFPNNSAIYDTLNQYKEQLENALMSIGLTGAEIYAQGAPKTSAKPNPATADAAVPDPKVIKALIGAKDAPQELTDAVAEAATMAQEAGGNVLKHFKLAVDQATAKADPSQDFIGWAKALQNNLMFSQGDVQLAKESEKLGAMATAVLNGLAASPTPTKKADPKPAKEWTNAEIDALEMNKDFTSAKYLNAITAINNFPGNANSVDTLEYLMKDAIKAAKEKGEKNFKKEFIKLVIAHAKGMEKLSGENVKTVAAQFYELAQNLLPGSIVPSPTSPQSLSLEAAKLVAKNMGLDAVAALEQAIADNKYPNAVEHIKLEGVAQALGVYVLTHQIYPELADNLKKLTQGLFAGADNLKKNGMSAYGSTAPKAPTYTINDALKEAGETPVGAALEELYSELVDDAEEGIVLPEELGDAILEMSTPGLDDTQIALLKKIADKLGGAVSAAPQKAPVYTLKDMFLEYGDTPTGTTLEGVYNNIYEAGEPVTPLAMAEAIEGILELDADHEDGEQIANLQEIVAKLKGEVPAGDTTTTSAVSAQSVVDSILSKPQPKQYPTAAAALNAGIPPSYSTAKSVVTETSNLLYQNIPAFKEAGPYPSVAGTAEFKAALTEQLKKTIQDNIAQGNTGTAEHLALFIASLDPKTQVKEQPKLPTAPKGLTFDDLIPAPQRNYTFASNAGGGTKPKEIWKDDDGNEYLFKPVPSTAQFLAYGEAAGGHIARLVNPRAPRIWVQKLNGRLGSMQEMLPNSGTLKGVAMEDLTLEQAQAIQREHVVDWLISNHDGHANQFLVLEGGEVVGIDKGQAYKYFGKDRLAIDYHPNEVYGEKEPIYNTFWRAYSKNQLTNVKKKLEEDYVDDLVKLEEKIKLLDSYVKELSETAEKKQAEFYEFKSEVASETSKLTAEPDIVPGLSEKVQKLEDDYFARLEKARTLGENEYWLVNFRPDRPVNNLYKGFDQTLNETFGSKGIRKTQFQPKNGITVADAEKLLKVDLQDGDKLESLYSSAAPAIIKALQEAGYDHVIVPKKHWKEDRLIALVPVDPGAEFNWEGLRGSEAQDLLAGLTEAAHAYVAQALELVGGEFLKGAARKAALADAKYIRGLKRTPKEEELSYTDEYGHTRSPFTSLLSSWASNAQYALELRYKSLARGVTPEQKHGLWKSIVGDASYILTSEFPGYIRDQRDLHAPEEELTEKRLKELIGLRNTKQVELHIAKQDRDELLGRGQDIMFRAPNEAIAALQQNLSTADFQSILRPYAQGRWPKNPAAVDAFLDYARQRKENLGAKFHRFFVELSDRRKRGMEALKKDESYANNDYAQMAESFKKHHGVDFTPEEYAAIHNYTVSTFRKLNRNLRETVPIEAQFTASKDWLRSMEYASLLEAALEKLPPHKGEVYRGQDMHDEELAQFYPGRVFHTKPFFSTSRTGGFGGRVRFVITSLTGRDVRDLSAHQSENEVLFAPNRNFLVQYIDRESAYKGNPVIEIHLLELPEVDFNEIR